MSGPDYILDIGGHGKGGSSAPVEGAGQAQGRPWVAIHWRCCGVYSRVYRNKEGTAYDGRCPRCGRQTRLKVGIGGTSCRFFEAG